MIAILILAGFIWITLRFWDRHDLNEIGFSRPQFLLWIGKGLALPLLVWMSLNTGILPRYPPVLAHVAAAVKSGPGQWLPAWLALVLPAVFVVSSYWTAATFAWLVALHALEMESSPREILSAAILWGALFLPVAALVLYLGGWAGAGLATVVVLVPILSEQLALGNPRRRKIHPVYSRALEKIKTGRYTAAEREVIRQLGKCDSDFDGWMMLAELYASHFNDLVEADRLVHQLCRQPDLTRQQMSDALHRLADWHLKLANDPAAARRVLEEICRAFPATHFGDVAQQRIARLPANY